MAKSIALLICDTPIGDVLTEHGDYHKIFTDLLNKATDQDFVLDPYEVRQLVYPDNIDQYDAIMLTGSASSAYEDKEWITKLVQYVADVANNKPHIKIIGICFGHQIVARALGGECVPNNGRWEVGPTRLTLSNIGKEIFNVESLSIQQMHRDHVPGIPPSFHLLGSTKVSMNQGMIKYSDNSEGGIHILTVQGHPEFTEPIVSKIVDVRSAAGVIDPETAADAMRRKDDRNDGVLVAKAIWKVIMS